METKLLARLRGAKPESTPPTDLYEAENHPPDSRVVPIKKHSEIGSKLLQRLRKDAVTENHLHDMGIDVPLNEKRGSIPDLSAKSPLGRGPTSKAKPLHTTASMGLLDDLGWDHVFERVEAHFGRLSLIETAMAVSRVDERQVALISKYWLDHSSDFTSDKFRNVEEAAQALAVYMASFKE